jgi:hypothetical protein
MPPPPVPIPPPVLWGDPTVIRQRLGDAVTDIAFDRSVMLFPALSVRHQRETIEKTAGPILKLVDMLTASDPAKLETFRREHDALSAQYFDDNCVHQGYLMTRAIKR